MQHNAYVRVRKVNLPMIRDSSSIGGKQVEAMKVVTMRAITEVT